MKRTLLYALFCFCSLSLPTAWAIPTTSTLIERTLAGASRNILDARFHRQEYEVIAARARFQGPLFDDEGNYLVEPGENWVWQLYETEPDPRLVFQQFVIYLGGDDHCWSIGECGYLSGIWAGWIYRCMPERDHELRVWNNGALIGVHEVRPTRFVPHVASIEHGVEIAPKKVSSDTQGTATDITVTVEDDLGCQQSLPDAVVRLSSTITNSGAHGHFAPAELGAGRFEALGYDSVLDPDGPYTAGRVIEGKTDA
ncbi:MAG: hypothetical protein MJA83_10680, partial [Gammaproteobacteria bacterium]|nr:hypothetical protein [Gammaproteobacteria bacterium]